MNTPPSRKPTSLMAALTALIFLASLMPAQSTLTTSQKMQFIQMAIKGAQEDLAQKDIPQARFDLMSVLGLVFRLAQGRTPPAFRQIISAYAQAGDRAWQGAPKSRQGTDVAAFLDAWSANKEVINKLKRLLNYFQMPSGAQAYNARIAEMLSQTKEARRLGEEICMKAPRPLHILRQRLLFRALFTSGFVEAMYFLDFGPAMATSQARNKVVPKLLEEARSTLAKAAQKAKPAEIWSRLNETRRALAILQQIASSLSNNKGFDKAGMAKQIAGLKARVSQENQRATALKEREIDSNRMPEDQWQGKQRDQIQKAVKAAYARKYKNEKVLRVTLQCKGYTERWESWWEGETARAGYFGYITAAVAVKQPKGTYRVFVSSFRRSLLLKDSTWGELVYAGLVYGFPIRAQNIGQ